jgi:hypothetical protein
VPAQAAVSWTASDASSAGGLQQFSTGVALTATGEEAQGVLASNNTTGFDVGGDNDVVSDSSASANSGAGVEFTGGTHTDGRNARHVHARPRH